MKQLDKGKYQIDKNDQYALVDIDEDTSEAIDVEIKEH